VSIDKSAYGKTIKSAKQNNDKSANANQALSGVTRFVPAEEAPSTHISTLKSLVTNVQARMPRKNNKTRLQSWYKFSAYEATQFTTKQNKTASNESCRLCGFGDGFRFFQQKIGGTRVFYLIHFFHPAEKNVIY
jgi:hypothetical protein